jgi:hypothetical protein
LDFEFLPKNRIKHYSGCVPGVTKHFIPVFSAPGITSFEYQCWREKTIGRHTVIAVGMLLAIMPEILPMVTRLGANS